MEEFHLDASEKLVHPLKYKIMALMEMEKTIPNNREEKLEFEWVPENEEKFHNTINNAPFDILFDMGFRIYDTYNSLVSDNLKLPGGVKSLIIQANGKDMFFDLNGVSKTYIESNKYLILFPKEWINSIPDDFIVYDLFLKPVQFKTIKQVALFKLGCMNFGYLRENLMLKQSNQ